MYPICLDIDISPSIFWESSIGELEDLINSYNRKKLNTNREKAVFYGILTSQIGEQVAMILDSKNGMTPKKIWEYYPALFEDEKLQFEEEQRQIQLELNIARMKDYMYRHNARLGGGK